MNLATLCLSIAALCINTVNLVYILTRLIKFNRILKEMEVNEDEDE